MSTSTQPSFAKFWPCQNFETFWICKFIGYTFTSASISKAVDEMRNCLSTGEMPVSRDFQKGCEFSKKKLPPRETAEDKIVGDGFDNGVTD